MADVKERVVTMGVGVVMIEVAPEVVQEMNRATIVVDGVITPGIAGILGEELVGIHHASIIIIKGRNIYIDLG